MSKLATQAVVLSIARIANYGLMLISPIILVRILTVEEFGRYREFLVYTSLLVAFAGFSVNDSLLYFIPAHSRSRWRIVKQTTILVACSSLIIVGTVAALDLALKGALIGRFLLPMSIYVLLYVNIDFWEWYWLASHRPVPVFLYTMSRLLARMVVVIVAAAATHSITVIVWSLIALEAVRITGSAIAWRSQSKGSEQPSLHGFWREQLRFCMPWGISVVFGMASRNLGNIVVVKLLGAASLAYYTIGLYGEPIVVALRNSISAVVLPEMVRRGALVANDQMPIWRRTTVLNCLMLFPIAVLLIRYAEPLIIKVFGNAYRPAIPVLQIYSLVVIRECFDLTLPLRSANRTAPLVQSSLVSLVTTAVCLAVLVPFAGIVGAAVALASAGVAETIYLGWRVARLIGVDPARLLPWGNIAKVAAAALLAGTVTLGNVWVNTFGFAGIAIAGTLYILAFAALIWLFKVPEADLLQDWARRAMRVGISKASL